MGFWDFLFGSNRGQSARRTSVGPGLDNDWTLSDNGNYTKITGIYRITIFESDGGYKYCIAKNRSDDSPFFSEPYETISAAKYEANATLDGRQGRYKSTTESFREMRAAERLGNDIDVIRSAFQAAPGVIKAFDALGELDSAKLYDIDQAIKNGKKCLETMTSDRLRSVADQVFASDITGYDALAQIISGRVSQAEKHAALRREKRQKPTP